MRMRWWWDQDGMVVGSEWDGGGIRVGWWWDQGEMMVVG